MKHTQTRKSLSKVQSLTYRVMALKWVLSLTSTYMFLTRMQLRPKWWSIVSRNPLVSTPTPPSGIHSEKQPKSPKKPLINVSKKVRSARFGKIRSNGEFFPPFSWRVERQRPRFSTSPLPQYLEEGKKVDPSTTVCSWKLMHGCSPCFIRHLLRKTH